MTRGQTPIQKRGDFGTKGAQTIHNPWSFQGSAVPLLRGLTPWYPLARSNYCHKQPTIRLRRC